VSRDSADSAASAWQAMRVLVFELNDRRADITAALGLSFMRIKALRYLARGPMSMRDLGATLLIDAPYTTVVVDDLEQRGLVERRPDPDDRRRKSVVVTAEGRRVARIAQRMLDEPPKALEQLSAEDLATLDRIMRTVLAASSVPPAGTAAGTAPEGAPA
jgi:DNA-binding MarR family transcriptional regulator